MALHIITLATDTTKMRFLTETAATFGVKITCIMLPSFEGGFFQRIMEYLRVVESLPDGDIACLIDAYDVLINQPEDVILARFHALNCRLLIGSELNCYPDSFRPMYNYVPATSLAQFPNGGGYIGYKDALLDFFTWKSPADMKPIIDEFTDQGYLHLYYLAKRSETVKLDAHCQIFQCMHWVSWKDIDIANGHIRNTILNTVPCFVHFNGGALYTQSRVDIQPIIVERMKKSLTTGPETLNDYEQLITPTCYPHPQV